MRFSPGAPELVASPDGAFVAMASGGRLALYSPDGNELAATAIPDGEADLGFVDGCLLCLVRDGGTQLAAYALPQLEMIAELELEERMRLCACVGMRALVANESLEQPRIVTVTSVLVLEPIPLREPLMFAAAAPDERLLVASRGRDQQLEVWEPAARRALFRLNLPLPSSAQQAGFASRRRLLWIVSGGDEAQLELYRFSDGRLQARAELGGRALGAAGHADSPRLIVAVQPREGEPELCALDFAAADRYELTPPIRPAAMCVVEGASPSLVLHAGAGGPPLFVPLARVLPDTHEAHATAPPPPVLTRATRTAPAISTLGKSHGKPPVALPPPLVPGSLPATTPPTRTPPTIRPPAQSRPPSEAQPLPRDGTWRDQLCAWAARLVADAGARLEVPELDEGSPLADAVERLSLDAQTMRLLALLYGARLLGHASLPAATVARALTADAPTEREWDEALGRGATALLGLTRASGGRVRLRPLVARFLDGAPPRIAIVPAGDGALEPPAGPALHDAGEATIEQAAAHLARAFGCPVAPIVLPPTDALPPLGRALLEARLHGAWPLVQGSDPSAWIDALVRVPSVILVHGAPPPSLAHLPRVG